MAESENTAPVRLPAHLAHDREVHVVISVLSGQQNAEKFYNETLHPFLTTNVPHLELKKNYFVHRTTSTSSIAVLTTKLFLFNAKKGVKQTILLLSGDGGMIDIISTLTTTMQREIDDTRPPSIFFKPTIVLFPEGTANALAHSAGIVSKDPLQVMMSGRARALPQFEVTFSRAARLVADEGKQRQEFVEPGCGEVGELGYYDPDGNVRVYGCVVFSWGLHASLVGLSDTAEMRKHGVSRFQMAAKELLEEGHTYKGVVKIQQERNGDWKNLVHKNTTNPEESHLHKYILATMVGNLEEKFCISPLSKPLDGSLRLVAVGNESSETLTKILTQAYEQGKHVEEQKDVLTYEKIDVLRIHFNEEDEKWRQVCIDGKIIAIEKGGWVEVRNMPAGGVDGRRVVELVC